MRHGGEGAYVAWPSAGARVCEHCLLFCGISVQAVGNVHVEARHRQVIRLGLVLNYSGFTNLSYVHAGCGCGRALSPAACDLCLLTRAVCRRAVDGWGPLVQPRMR